MKVWVPCCVALTVAATAAAHAASDSLGIDPARQALAREVNAACQRREALTEYFNQMARSQTALARSANQNITDAQWLEFEAYLRAELHARLDDYMTFVANIEARHLTADELKAQAAFCRTPAGRGISAARIRIEAETFAVRQEWLNKTMAEALSSASEKMQPTGGGL